MINPFKKIKELEKEIESLKSTDYKATKVIESLLNREIGWFNYEELEYQDMVTYKQDARSIVANKTFINEYNHYIHELVTHIAKEVSPGDVKSFRYAIIAIESLRERLESIKDPNENIDDDNIHDAI